MINLTPQEAIIILIDNKYNFNEIQDKYEDVKDYQEILKQIIDELQRINWKEQGIEGDDMELCSCLKARILIRMAKKIGNELL